MGMNRLPDVTKICPEDTTAPPAAFTVERVRPLMQYARGTGTLMLCTA